MILVDIYVPSLDKTYDFQVDESVTVENLIMEIGEMIGNESKSGKNIKAERLLLCSMDLNMVFQKTSSLQGYGIQNGHRLMLV